MIDVTDYQRLNALGDSVDWNDSYTAGRYCQFAKYLKPGIIDVLDMGCHTGAGGKTLKPMLRDLRIVGLDVCPEFVAALPRDIYAAGVVSSATSIDVLDSSFDAVLAGEFIEHLTDADVGPAIRECYRILRPEGQFLLTTPNPGYFKLILTGGSVLGGSHLSAHEPRRLCRRIAAHGFEHIRVRGSGRVSRIVGERFPILAAYGSYLVIAEKR